MGWKHTPCLEDVMKHMLNWIGDREYKVIAWSENDYNQFHEKLSLRKSKMKEFKTSWIKKTGWIIRQSLVRGLNSTVK